MTTLEEILVGVSLSQFPNNLHFPYTSESLALFMKYNPSTLGIKEFFDPFELSFQKLDTAFEYSPKSPETERIARLDEEFDLTFAGMRNYSFSFLKHFNEDDRYAAENLKIIFDKYGNIARQPYRQAIGSSHNLVQELRNRPDDIQKINLTSWIDAHEAAAKKVADLLDKRIEEMSQQTNLRIREVRQEVDFYYHKIVNRINAMINIHGKDYVPGFFEEFNRHATEYNNKYAIHIGRIQAEKEKNKDKENKNEETTTNTTTSTNASTNTSINISTENIGKK
jgi:hypothetical protein